MSRCLVASLEIQNMSNKSRISVLCQILKVTFEPALVFSAEEHYPDVYFDLVRDWTLDLLAYLRFQ